MISVLLTVLKVLGILILSLLGIAILVLLLVLFVPVRYQVYAERKLERELPFGVKLKAAWLFHLLNVHFSYPEAAYIKVRIGCFTVFRSDRTKERSKEKPEENLKEKKTLSKEENFEVKTREEQETKEDREVKENRTAEEDGEVKEEQAAKEDGEVKEDEKSREREKIEEEKPVWQNFIKKFLDLLKNLRYTITQICDKIKKIVKNIKYYIEVINSAEFRNAFQLCSFQAGVLLRHICPQKIKGSLRIGTGDPASTGQVLAVYGMLYPFLGNQIMVTPDFEQQIVEGELSIKGRITLFRLIRCAWIVYFNKNLRRVINMLKREAV